MFKLRSRFRRFPHLAFRNGGGTFLLISFIMVFILGLPLFLAELFIGQYLGLGTTTIKTQLLLKLNENFF